MKKLTLMLVDDEERYLLTTAKLLGKRELRLSQPKAGNRL